MNFIVVPPVQLATLLPNLPNNPWSENTGEKVCDHFPADEMEASALDLVLRFLVYPTARRLKAVDALSHPWFGGDVLLPETYPLDEKSGLSKRSRSLQLWIQSVLSHSDE